MLLDYCPTLCVHTPALTGNFMSLKFSSHTIPPIHVDGEMDFFLDPNSLAIADLLSKVSGGI